MDLNDFLDGIGAKSRMMELGNEWKIMGWSTLYQYLCIVEKTILQNLLKKTH